MSEFLEFIFFTNFDYLSLMLQKSDTNVVSLQLLTFRLDPNPHCYCSVLTKPKLSSEDDSNLRGWSFGWFGGSCPRSCRLAHVHEHFSLLE